MATKSPLGEPSVPKPSNQGSAASKKFTQAPRTSGAPGGFMKRPGSLDQPKRRGVTPKPQGGSGDGSHKGDKLPR